MITKSYFDKMPDGREVYAYTLKNSKNASVKIITLGGRINELNIPDKNGNLADVVLGYADPMSYFGDGPCSGKTPGRYANRVALGKFTLA